jgi:hypothetical protein
MDSGGFADVFPLREQADKAKPTARALWHRKPSKRWTMFEERSTRNRLPVHLSSRGMKVAKLEEWWEFGAELAQARS